MKVYHYLGLCLVFLVFSCKNKETKPKVSYEKPTQKKVANTNKPIIQVADLPISFPGTSFLLHPIADVELANQSTKTSYISSDNRSNNFVVSNYAENEITGFLQNIMFQEVHSDSLRALSENKILIESVTYLKSLAIKNGKKILVYTLMDQDTNQDGKFDSDDIKTLYLSDISGQNFIKIAPDFHEVVDWSFVDSQQRIYFRTIQDSNKNGDFDTKDGLHYYYYDFLNSEKSIEYFPVKNP